MIQSVTDSESSDFCFCSFEGQWWGVFVMCLLLFWQWWCKQCLQQGWCTCTKTPISSPQASSDQGNWVWDTLSGWRMEVLSLGHPWHVLFVRALVSMAVKPRRWFWRLFSSDSVVCNLRARTKQLSRGWRQTFNFRIHLRTWKIQHPHPHPPTQSQTPQHCLAVRQFIP